MSRKRPEQYKSVTVNLSPEDAFALDRAMIDFGIESKSGMMTVILRAWLSMVPVDTTVYEMSQVAIRQARKVEFDSLATYYENRAKELRR